MIIHQRFCSLITLLFFLHLSHTFCRITLTRSRYSLIFINNGACFAFIHSYMYVSLHMWLDQLPVDPCLVRLKLVSSAVTFWKTNKRTWTRPLGTSQPVSMLTVMWIVCVLVHVINIYHLCAAFLSPSSALTSRTWLTRCWWAEPWRLTCTTWLQRWRLCSTSSRPSVSRPPCPFFQSPFWVWPVFASQVTWCRSFTVSGSRRIPATSWSSTGSAPSSTAASWGSWRTRTRRCAPTSPPRTSTWSTCKHTRTRALTPSDRHSLFLDWFDCIWSDNPDVLITFQYSFT